MLKHGLPTSIVVYLYIYIYIYIYVYLHIHIYTYAYICIGFHIYKHMLHICIYIYLHQYTYTYTLANVYTCIETSRLQTPSETVFEAGLSIPNRRGRLRYCRIMAFFRVILETVANKPGTIVETSASRG